METNRSNRQERTILIMKLALIAIARNEDHYLKEWYEYHHKIGFDDIYVYQNNWRYVENTPSYVHLIEWDGTCQQIPAYNDFIENKRHNFDWGLFIDVDEFFVPIGFKDAREFFESCKHRFAIGLNWKLFGSNGHEKADYSKGVIERFTKSQVGFNQHIKIALNFEKLVREMIIDDIKFINPHFIGLGLRYNIVFSYDGSYMICGPFAPIYGNPTNIPYIAHYVTKSREEFIERRSRVRADTHTPRSDLEGFWNEHNVNEVDNFDVLRFAQV